MASLKWYLNRLSSMSLPEMIHRVQEKSTILRERYFVANRPVDPASLLDQLDQVGSQRRGEWGYRFTVSPDDPTLNTAATLEIAEQLLANKISLFGHELELTDPPNWHADPLTKRVWPNEFHDLIDKRDGKTIGGCKWVWELNRHHHLITLAKAYYLTKEERFAEKVVSDLISWVDTNRYLHGINWTSALELALRVINWTWSLSLIRESTHLTEDRFQKILFSINQQADYIESHLSAFSSANNHLIGEVAGLGVVGFCFPFLPKAERWQQKCTQVLERELHLQIYPDGVTAEQALSYLGFVLDFNLIVWQLAEKAGQQPPQIWFERLGAAANFLAHVLDKNGNTPPFGDSDDAWVVRLDDDPAANNYRSLLATAATLLERPDFKKNAGMWDEKNHWLLGIDAKSRFDAIPVLDSTPQPVSKLFQTGGYAVLRHRDRLALIDFGELGYLSTAAHGHADSLSIWLSVKGEPVLVDPGTYAYQEGYEWRNYFRSTKAHNTISIDNQDQSEMQGQFLWGLRANSRLISWQSESGYDLIAATHDGYERIGVNHERAVFFEKEEDIIIVLDKLKGQDRHFWEQLWHLPPHLNFEIDNGVCRISKDAPLISLHFAQKQIDVVSGEKDPIGGWHSPEYGQIAASPTLIVSGTSQLPLTLQTIIDLNPEQQDSFSNRSAVALEKFKELI